MNNLQTDATTGPPLGPPNSADQRTYWLTTLCTTWDWLYAIYGYSKLAHSKSICAVLALIPEETGSIKNTGNFIEICR